MDWRVSALNEKSMKPREEAIEKIENYIVKNELQAEDRLPSERTMCELWNCNRSKDHAGLDLGWLSYKAGLGWLSSFISCSSSSKHKTHNSIKKFFENPTKTPSFKY